MSQTYALVSKLLPICKEQAHTITVAGEPDREYLVVTPLGVPVTGDMLQPVNVVHDKQAELDACYQQLAEQEAELAYLRPFAGYICAGVDGLRNGPPVGVDTDQCDEVPSQLVQPEPIRFHPVNEQLSIDPQSIVQLSPEITEQVQLQAQVHAYVNEPAHAKEPVSVKSEPTYAKIASKNVPQVKVETVHAHKQETVHVHKHETKKSKSTDATVVQSRRAKKNAKSRSPVQRRSKQKPFICVNPNCGKREDERYRVGDIEGECEPCRNAEGQILERWYDPHTRTGNVFSHIAWHGNDHGSTPIERSFCKFETQERKECTRADCPSNHFRIFVPETPPREKNDGVGREFDAYMVDILMAAGPKIGSKPVKILKRSDDKNNA